MCKEIERRMVVLQFIPSMSVADGGTTTYMRQLIPALAKEVNLHVCALCLPDELADKCVEGVHYHLLPSKLWCWWRLKKAWMALLDEVRPDVLHVNCCWLPQCALVQSWFASWFEHHDAGSGKGKAPVVLTPHGMLEPWIMSRNYYTKKWWALLLYQRRAVAEASCIVATADEEKTHLLDLGWNDQVVMIPNGMDVANVIMKSDWKPVRKLLFMSRIHPKKGLEMLLEALAAMKQQGAAENVPSLCIAGDGEPEYVTKLKNLCTNLKLEDSCFFLGPVYGEKKYDLLREADVLVLPSYSENFGLVVTEALAVGTPVITTTGTPWSALNVNDCGWWVAPEAPALTEAVTDAMTRSKENLKQMGHNARSLVESQFNIANTAQGLKALYRKLSMLLVVCLFSLPLASGAFAQITKDAAAFQVELRNPSDLSVVENGVANLLPSLVVDKKKLSLDEAIDYMNGRYKAEPMPEGAQRDSHELYRLLIGFYGQVYDETKDLGSLDFQCDLLYYAANLKVKDKKNREALDLLSQAYDKRNKIMAEDASRMSDQYAKILRIQMLRGLIGEKSNLVDQALAVYEGAFKQETKIFKNDPKTHLPLMSQVLKRIAHLYQVKNDEEKLKVTWKDLDFILRTLAEMDPDNYSREQALFYMNCAIYYGNRRNYQTSVVYYTKAVKIYLTMIVSDVYYEYHLAMANLYRGYDNQKIGHLEDSEVDYKSAIEICRRHPGYDAKMRKYRNVEVQSLTHIGELCELKLFDLERSEAYFADARRVREEEYKMNPNDDVAVGNYCDAWFRHVQLGFNHLLITKEECRDQLEEIKKLAERFPENEKCKATLAKIKSF